MPRKRLDIESALSNLAIFRQLPAEQLALVARATRTYA
jgi:hypothetical protein